VGSILAGREPNPLIALFRQCVVCISDTEGKFRGTGFFVAPGRMLTCAHVVHSARGLQAQWQDHVATVAVAGAAPPLESVLDPASYPLPDLAVLELEGDAKGWNHPCVALTAERPVIDASPAALYLAGYTIEHAGGRVLTGVTAEFESLISEGPHTFYKLKRGQVPPGFSGSPLLDLQLWSVAGIVESTRGRHTELGGFAVPAGALAEAFPDVIKANGEFHRRDNRWAAAVDAEVTYAAERAGMRARLPLRPAMVGLAVDEDMPAAKMLRVPPEMEAPSWVVDRPAEVSAVVTALLGHQAGTVGITTGLHGAGGFGKTTLALMVCTDRRVRRRFRDHVYFVTMGRDVRGPAAVAAKVNDVIKLVVGEDATFTNPDLAGARLSALLDIGPRRLLVLDDVWAQEQLAPFTGGGRRCACLVTTRVPGLVVGRGMPVRVDQMSPEQARVLLTSGLLPLGGGLVEELLAVTGRWPLLLRLVNKILANAAQAGADMPAAGAQLLGRLRAGGPTVVDDLSGEASQSLEVGQPQERARAVLATIEASTSLLGPQDTQRFAELGVFAEDETIPFGLAARLWRATAGMDELQASQLLARLGGLALVSPPDIGTEGVALHDVVRDFLRNELGQQRLSELNGVLLDAVAADLPTADLPDATAAGPSGTAWWELSRGDRYLRDHLIRHLLDAGRRSDAERVACDLRWVGARVLDFGPAAPAADLSLVDTQRAAHLRGVLARAAHLLAPTEPAGAVVDVLHSRVADDPDWGAQVIALRNLCHRPRLVNHWPLPDQPDSALRRTLTSHSSWVNAMVIAPDGSWLAAGGGDGRVRVWDTGTWQERAVLSGHRRGEYAVAIAPDGSWLAAGGGRGRVRVWDAATWQERAVLSGHRGGVKAVAIAPDGSWLAAGGWDGRVRVWDTGTWQERAVLSGHTRGVYAVAIAPDGSWLAAGGGDGRVRVWDAATWQERAVLSGHTNWVNAVAIAPDGSWLAAGGGDGRVRVWDTATGQERTALADDNGEMGVEVEAVVIAPDGSWLAAVCSYRELDRSEARLQIWDAATGQERAVLTDHKYGVSAVAVAPDGGWLATGGRDGTVRIWDAAATSQKRTGVRHVHEVRMVAIAPHGSWLATRDGDGMVRIWDAATGQERSVLTGHRYQVEAVAIAPDGSWLATGDWEGTVRIWDTGTWQERAVLTGHRYQVEAVAIAPDGSWLAVGGGERRVRIWDTGTWQERAVLSGHRGVVKAVAIAPDGSWLAVGGGERRVRIWDTGTWQERAVLSGHRGVVKAVAIAPDGSWLAVGGTDETVRTWNTGTWQERAVLTGHRGGVNAVAIAPDGSWLASGGGDETVRIWDAANGQLRALMRVEDAIFACAWHDTGRLTSGGAAGLYTFEFLVDTASTSAKHGDG
jgi:WD40 repeat protein